METTSMWVFGYGSLMWNPGFAHEENVLAHLPGYARTFCMWSIHHRGTPEDPGLVLALDEHGASRCDGLALKIAQGHEQKTLEYLRERELISSAYLERQLPVILRDGRTVEAVTYVVDRSHVQYCGDLPLQRQADVIASASGGRGANSEYLFNTVSHLAELGISDPDLEWLAGQVRNKAVKGSN